MKNGCWCGHNWGAHDIRETVDLICKECNQNCESAWLKKGLHETTPSSGEDGITISQNGDQSNTTSP